MTGKTNMRGKVMERVRIVDIAQELGVSTATVSNVIHGKTNKISERTVEKVQQILEERQYIPSMAGILLAQNDSKIICVVVNDHEKYEKRVLQDAFVVGSIDYLSEVIEQTGFFMMLKKTKSLTDIIRYASMWNVAGLVLMGFCEQDYEKLRDKIHVPFVVYDGSAKAAKRYADISIDHYSGGYQMGNYLWHMGHRKVLFLADNDISMDHERYLGLQKALEEHGRGQEKNSEQWEKHGRRQQEQGKEREEWVAHKMIVPMQKAERMSSYKEALSHMKEYTAVFCASDVYAIELMNFLSDEGIRVPQDISVAGFDDIPESTLVRPKLTTIHQDMKQRAQKTMEILEAWRDGRAFEENTVLPVTLAERDSVQNRQK